VDAANHPAIGCAFASESAAIAALRSATDSGAVAQWRIGATDRERVARIAEAIGSAATLDPADPLAGIAGLASGAHAATGVNRGAVAGGIIGAVGGLLAGLSPLGAIVPVDASDRAVACALLFFAIGVAVGGVLGGAFGPRPSTHAGFRLIDAMEAGEIAAVAVVASDRLEALREALVNAGASEITIVEAPRV